MSKEQAEQWAEQWAEEYLNKHKDLLGDYDSEQILFGRWGYIVKDGVMTRLSMDELMDIDYKDLHCVETVEDLSAEEIIERYSEHLTEEQLKILKNK